MNRITSFFFFCFFDTPFNVNFGFFFQIEPCSQALLSANMTCLRWAHIANARLIRVDCAPINIVITLLPSCLRNEISRFSPCSQLMFRMYFPFAPARSFNIFVDRYGSVSGQDERIGLLYLDCYKDANQKRFARIERIRCRTEPLRHISHF